MSAILAFLLAHKGIAATVGATLLEIVLRKIPGATPMFQAMDNMLDQVPGLKNK